MKRIVFLIGIIVCYSQLFAHFNVSYAADDAECSIKIVNDNEISANKEFTLLVQAPPSGHYLASDDKNTFEIYIIGLNNKSYFDTEHTNTWSSLFKNDTTWETKLKLPATVAPDGTPLDGIYSIVANVAYRKAQGFRGFGIWTSQEHTTCKTEVVVKTDGNIENVAEFRTIDETQLRSEILANPTGYEPNRVDGSTKSVSINFYGLTPGMKYKACLNSNFEERCVKQNKFNFGEGTDVELIADDKGEIKFFKYVCGNGNSGLKMYLDDNNVAEECKPGDYFHEGYNYSISLFTVDYESGPIIVGNFYVHHIYPQIILSGEHNNKDNISLNLYYYYLLKNSDDSLNSILSTTETLDYFLSTHEVDNPLVINLLAPIKNKWAERNSYQIEIQNLATNFKTTKCYQLYGNLGQDASKEFRFYATDVGGTLPLGPLPPGQYSISINKQINVDDLERGNCQGGFTYYKFPLTITQDKKDSSLLHTFVDGNLVQVDPDEMEFKSALSQYGTSTLPCVSGKNSQNQTVTINKNDPLEYKIEKLSSIVECTRYTTAIGSFGTDPLGFISTLGTWLFRIAAISTFCLMIYAGILFQLSRGDKEKIGKAREIITAAITGLIFLILSVSILQIIGIDILKIPGFTREEPVASPTPIPTLPPGRPADRGR